MRSARNVIVIVLFAMLVSVLAPLNSALTVVHTLTVEPVSGVAGTTSITVDGAGFAPGFPPCEVFFDGTKRADCNVDQSGAFSVTFTVPSGVQPGTGMRISACNNCNAGEFAETAEVSFTVDASPPTTTTTTSPTTTTTGATTTTTSSTTTTTLPVQGLAPIDASFGLGDGIFGRSTNITVVDDLITIPDVWFLRCTEPRGATIWDFDDKLPGSSPSFLRVGRVPGIVVEPEYGTFSAPYALRVSAGTAMWRTFVPGQQEYVGLYVGLVEPSADPVTLRLGGLSQAGDTIDIDEVVLGPEASPANTCLLVRARSGSKISSITIEAFPADGQSVDIDVDSVFFGNEPYPAEGGFEQADMELIFPTPGTRVDAARGTVILGRVTWPSGIDLSGVRLALPNWDRSELMSYSARIAPSVLSDDGLESSALFWLDGVRVPPGSFTVTATSGSPGLMGEASLDLVGTGPPAPPPDEYGDLVASKVDILPWAMEVTQAIRGPLEIQAAGSTVTDDFRLVEGKKTVVRGYAVQSFPAIEPPGRPLPLPITARLYGFRDGAALPGSPLIPETLEVVDVFAGEPGPDLEKRMRPQIDRTWNFLLPFTWTTGQVTLKMEVNPASDPGYVEEVPLTSGFFNTLTRTVTFRDTGRVSAFPVLVDFSWRCTQRQIDEGWDDCAGGSVGDLKSAAPTETQARNSLAWWWKVLPARGESPYFVDFGGVKIAQRNPSSAIDLGRPLTSGVSTGIQWNDLNSAFDELYCDNGSWFPSKISTPQMRTFSYFLTPNAAPIGGGCAWVGNPTMFRTSLSGPTLAQEAAHTAGLRHSGVAHDEANGRIRWLPDHGGIASAGAPTWGFDTNAMAVVREPTREHVHDYLSYGGWPIWTSVEVWNHMFDDLLANRPTGERRGRSASGGATGGGEGGGGERIVVTAAVTDAGLVLGKSYLTAVAGSDPGEPIEVTLLNAAGGPIGTTDGWLLPGPSHAVDANPLLRVDLPPGTEVAGIALPDDGGSVVVSGPGPSVDEVVADVADGRLNLSWSGASADGFLIEATLDGSEWWLIGSADEPRLDVDVGDLALDGPEWRIRVQASDGVRVASADVASVDLGPATVVASITAPLADSFVRGGMITASAGATSLGSIDEFTYRWMLNGELIGEGLEVPIPLLTPGLHEITLTVSGPGGEDTDTVGVSVIVDEDGDGMDDEWELSVGLDPTDGADGSTDADGDALQNVWEFQGNTDPQSIDTDGDGYADPIELSGGSDPTDPGDIPSFLNGVPGTRAPTIDTFEALPASTPPREEPVPLPAGESLPWVYPALAGIVLLGIGVGVFRWRTGRGTQG